MEEQILSPGMQDADYTDLGSQVFGIDGDLQQGLRAGQKQQVVEQARVFQGQHIEFVGHGEHDTEVISGQEFALARLPLALGAAPISALSCTR
jgi:hypothetical protein